MALEFTNYMLDANTNNISPIMSGSNSGDSVNQYLDLSKQVANLELQNKAYREPERNIIDSIGRALYDTSRYGRVLLSPIYSNEDARRQNYQAQQQDIANMARASDRLLGNIEVPQQLEALQMKNAERAELLKYLPQKLKTDEAQNELALKQQQFVYDEMQNKAYENNYLKPAQNEAMQAIYPYLEDIDVNNQGGKITSSDAANAAFSSKPVQDMVKFNAMAKLMVHSQYDKSAKVMLEKQLADNGASIAIKDGKQFLNYNGRSIEINHDNIVAMNNFYKRQAAEQLKLQNYQANLFNNQRTAAHGAIVGTVIKLNPEMQPQDAVKLSSSIIAKYTPQQLMTYNANRMISEIYDSTVPQQRKDQDYVALQEIAPAMGFQVATDSQGKIIYERDEQGNVINVPMVRPLSPPNIGNASYSAEAIPPITLRQVQDQLKLKDNVSYDLDSMNQEYAQRNMLEQQQQKQIANGENILNKFYPNLKQSELGKDIKEQKSNLIDIADAYKKAQEIYANSYNLNKSSGKSERDSIISASRDFIKGYKDYLSESSTISNKSQIYRIFDYLSSSAQLKGVNKPADIQPMTKEDIINMPMSEQMLSSNISKNIDYLQQLNENRKQYEAYNKDIALRKAIEKNKSESGIIINKNNLDEYRKNSESARKSLNKLLE